MRPVVLTLGSGAHVIYRYR
jgi:hypothetical protein